MGRGEVEVVRLAIAVSPSLETGLENFWYAMRLICQKPGLAQASGRKFGSTVQYCYSISMLYKSPVWLFAYEKTTAVHRDNCRRWRVVHVSPTALAADYHPDGRVNMLARVAASFEV